MYVLVVWQSVYFFVALPKGDGCRLQVGSSLVIDLIDDASAALDETAMLAATQEAAASAAVSASKVAGGPELMLLRASAAVLMSAGVAEEIVLEYRNNGAGTVDGALHVRLFWATDRRQGGVREGKASTADPAPVGVPRARLFASSAHIVDSPFSVQTK